MRFKSPVLDDSDTPFKKGGIRKTAKCVSPIKARIDNKPLGISAKGGVIKNDVLSVSSYRLTTYDNLKNKLDFIKSQHERFNFYLICARELDEEKGVLHYTVLKVPSAKFAPSRMLNVRSWSKVRAGYELKEGKDFNARIVSKMSNQLWYAIPLECFTTDETLLKLSIPLKDLGKGLIDFLYQQGVTKQS